jgi:hypothetical protein
MAMYTGIYVVRAAITVSTAITVLQVKAGASRSFDLLRAWLTQKGGVGSAQEEIEILRKTAAATVSAFTPVLLRPGDAAADAAGGTSATGHTATAEGTDGDIIIHEGFNVLNGWLYLPVPEERIRVPAGGILAMKFPSAPGSQAWKLGMVFGELG